MYLRYLEYLRLVIDHGSFAAAARAGGVTQPAISHGLARLQRHFEAPLFERSGRRRVPTATAMRAALQGQDLTEQIGSGADQPDKAGRRKTWRVGVTPSAALVCGPALYEACRGGASDRRLEMCSADEGRMLAQLQGGELDLVVAPRPRGHQGTGLHSLSLYGITPLVYARQRHPLTRARTLEQLQSAEWGIVGPSVSGPVDVLQEAHAVRRMRPPKVAVSCPDYTSLLQLVRQTDLLCVLPHPVLLGDPGQALLVALPLREGLPRYDMQLFMPARPGRSLQAVVDLLLARMVPD